MKETLYISLLILFVYIFLFMNKNKNKILIEAHGIKLMVCKDDKQKESAKLLSNIVNDIIKFKTYLYKTRKDTDCLKYEKYIKQLHNNLNSNTLIYENCPDSKYTSYSVNKGEELAICLKDKETTSLHDKNLLMYVVLHEIAHIACPEVGHTELFKDIFAFFVRKAIDINLYKYENYDDNPVNYCGMILSSNII